MRKMRIDEWPLVLLIFFFNSFYLPHGLLFSAILTPVFLYYTYKSQRFKYVLLGLLVQTSFALIHWYNGADPMSLLVSNFLALTVLIFAVYLSRWFSGIKDISDLFRKLLTWNTLLLIPALIILLIPNLRGWLWYEVPISPGIPSFPRLKLFTYEASYYALLFTPIFLFYFWKILVRSQRSPLIISLAILLPMILSLSFGVIGGIALALMLTIAIKWNQLNEMNGVKSRLSYGTALIVMSGLALFIVSPENPVFDRISNILAGTDTSAKGRLVESFVFAFDLAKSKSLIFGAGLGQIKILAYDMIVNHYQYEGEFANIVRIPNSMAEWLASFGLIGFVGKIVLELYLFKRFKVFDSIYGLSLFIFMFIYQFTGSFLVNSAEVIIWSAAFFLKPDVGLNLSRK